MVYLFYTPLLFLTSVTVPVYVHTEYQQSVALTQDSLEIARHGVFTGYNPLVLLSIVLQALTGLVSFEMACYFVREMDGGYSS